MALSRVDGFVVHATYTGIAAGFIAFSRVAWRRRWRYWLLSICIPTIFHTVGNALVSRHKSFGEYATAYDVLPEPMVILLGISIAIIAIGIFFVLFVQLRRSVFDDQAIKQSLWKAEDKVGTVLLAFGVFGMTKGAEALLVASTNPPSAGHFVNFVLLVMGLLFVLGGFAILKRGWGRVS